MPSVMIFKVILEIINFEWSFLIFDKFIKTKSHTILFETTFQFLCTFANVMFFSVVLITIAPNQRHISYKLTRTWITVMTQFSLDRTHVHRIFDDVKIVQNIELGWLNRIMKPKWPLKSKTLRKNSSCRLLPMLIVTFID